MCHRSCSGHLSSEDSISPEESLLIYCKPVELYNIINRRASENPLFLRRCLRYKIEARRKRRLNAGAVIFSYRGYNKKVPKIEVTEEFSCPFCLLQCASFKGLRHHLCSSHDLFKFDFWVSEECQAVDVSVKVDLLDSKIIADGVHPGQQTFFFSSKPRLRLSRKLVRTSNNVFPQLLVPDSAGPGFYGICKGNLRNDDDSLSRKDSSTVKLFPRGNNLQTEWHEGTIYGPDCHNAREDVEYIASSFNTGVPIATAQSYTDPELGFEQTQSVKLRKLSAEQTASRNRMLLQKRQFFHSHRAQPMALDQVLADRDSEDEVDDEIADFDDRRMLEDFVDVSKDEKHFMHLWNSFVRKQRVLADGHVPWACKAFSELHAQKLTQVPALFWCWRLFMIKLWNHGLLDAGTMNDCNIFLEGYRVDAMDATEN